MLHTCSGWGDALGERRGVMVGDTRGDSRGEDLGLFPVS